MGRPPIQARLIQTGVLGFVYLYRILNLSFQDRGHSVPEQFAQNRILRTADTNFPPEHRNPLPPSETFLGERLLLPNPEVHLKGLLQMNDLEMRTMPCGLLNGEVGCVKVLGERLATSAARFGGISTTMSAS